MALVKSTLRNRPVARYIAPMGGMDDFFQQFENMLQPFAPRGEAGYFPTPFPLDLYESGDDVVLEMAVPGLKPEQLDISLEGRQLSIRGTVPEVEEGDGEGAVGATGRAASCAASSNAPSPSRPASTRRR